MLKNIKSLILDMDGVLWRGSDSIGELGKIFPKIEKSNLNYILATNNSTLTPSQYQQKLFNFGARVNLQNILTSSLVAAKYLGTRFPEGGPVFILGENGLIEALKERGFFHSTVNVLAVIVGMDRQINYDKLSKACLLIRSGVPFIGTNSDRSFPTPQGLVPGAGAILAALEVASDVSPIILGKPELPLYAEALRILHTSEADTLVVGDRLETDILGGQKIGCKTACVLSGVTTKEQAVKWEPVPDLIMTDLEELIAYLTTI